MDHFTDSTAPPDQRSGIRSICLVSLILLLLILAEGQILPRIDDSAEPSLLAVGPWSWPFVRSLSPSIAPSLPVFLAIALLASLSAVYAVGLARLRTAPARTRTLVVVLVTTLLLNLAVVISVPTRKADLFYYAFQGRMIAREHVNPYALSPRSRASDSWFPFVSPVWRDLTTGYGPAWLLLSAGVDALADRGGTLHDFVWTILAFRALLAASSLANSLLIWAILSELAPERRLLGTIAYAWNPAVLVVGVEHNDTLMLFLALAGLWLHGRRRPVLAVIALSLSTLVKYVTAPLLLLYLFWAWREREGRARNLLAGLVAATAVLVLTIAPFNPPTVLAHAPSYVNGSGRLYHVEHAPIAVVVFMAAILAIRIALLKPPHRLRHILEVATLALFGYLAVVSRDWFPWYAISAVGLSAILGGWWLEVAAAAGAAWLLGSHDGTSYLAGLSQQAFGTAPATTVAIILLGPPALMGAAGTLWRWRGWSTNRLLAAGLTVLAALTLATEIPLVAHWSDGPRDANLGGGRAPGAEVFGTALEWDDWSWKTVVDQIDTPAGPSGPRSLCLTFPTTRATFFAHHPGFSTRGYEILTFVLGPPHAKTPSLQVEIDGTDGQPLRATSLDTYIASASTIDGWRQVRIPLAVLRASNTRVTGVLLRSGPDTVGETVCLQDLAFR